MIKIVGVAEFLTWVVYGRCERRRSRVDLRPWLMVRASVIVASRDPRYRSASFLRFDWTIVLMAYRSLRRVGCSGRYRSTEPCSTAPMMSMRPLQHGHRCETVSSSVTLVPAASSAFALGIDTRSSARDFATFSARSPHGQNIAGRLRTCSVGRLQIQVSLQKQP